MCSNYPEKGFKEAYCLLPNIVKSSVMIHIATSVFYNFLFLPEETKCLSIASPPL